MTRRYYSTLKADDSYKRRITWVEKLPVTLSDDPSVLDKALVEYTGM